jgi:myo-inositol-1(or 4)-monophosphatase
MLGSAALDLAWVADGKIDASIMLSNKPWDVVAGVLIAQEAGAVVSDQHGQPYSLHSKSIVATAPPIQSSILQVL